MIKMIYNKLIGIININKTSNYVYNSVCSAFAKAKASRDLRVWITFSSNNQFSEQLYQKIQDISKLKYPEIKFYQIKDMHECKKTKILFKQDDESGNTIKLFEDNTNPANLIILDSEDSFATLGMVAEYYQNFSNRTLILKSAKHNLIENASFTNKRCLNLLRLIKPNYYYEYKKFEDAINIIMKFLDDQILTNMKKFIEEKDFDIEDMLFMAFYILQESNINKAIDFIKKKYKK